MGFCSHVATMIYKLSLGKNQKDSLGNKEEESLDINEAQQNSRLYPNLSSIPGPSGISSTRLTTTIEIANQYDE